MLFFNKSEAEHNQMKDIDQAVASGRWLVAVFSLDGDGVLCKRTTFEFPKEKFEACVDSLRKALTSELTGSLPDTPLPVASGFMRRAGWTPSVESPPEVQTTRAPVETTKSPEIEEYMPDDIRPRTFEIDGGDIE